MTRQCPECKRMLELNKTNFRFSFGSWRTTCRACQNEHKRKQYRGEKAKQTEKPNPYKQAQAMHVKAMIAKYGKILRTLNKLGISPDAPAEFVDTVLENANRSDRKSA